ncbi:hypothetical protein EDB85DRAFT_1889928 [Lactarius pseudohatsudake]|nr:hypothetical protein EDB85DRAFT_1889928 [Lactarius pseudohatsudake]
MDPPYRLRPITVASLLSTGFISVILHCEYVSVVVFNNELNLYLVLSNVVSLFCHLDPFAKESQERLVPTPCAPAASGTVGTLCQCFARQLLLPTQALIWQVRFLCTTLLPYAETRLVPAGRVLLQSLGLHGDFSQRVPIRTDEETRCCFELFIALTHEVLLKDAVSAGELEGPCKLLHTTFKDISFKLGAFSVPKLNEAGLKASSTEALELERFSSVLRALSSVMGAFEHSGWTRSNPPLPKDGALRDHHRMALLELSVSTGLTMEQYRKKLDQNLAQTQTRLNSFLGQTDELLPRTTSTVHPHQGEISTIEEGSEAEGEGSSANSHAQSHSTLPSHSTQGHSDSGRRNSLRRRILRRLLPSSMGKRGE